MPEQADNPVAPKEAPKSGFGNDLNTVSVFAETPGSDSKNDPLNYKVSQPFNDQPNTLVFCDLNDGTCSFPNKISEGGKTDPLTFTNDIFNNADRDGNKELSRSEVTALGEKISKMGELQKNPEKKDDKTDLKQDKPLESNAKEYKEMTDLVINSFDDVTKLDKSDGAGGKNAEGITKKDIEAYKKLTEKDPSSLTKEESALLNKLKGGDKKPVDKPTDKPKPVDLDKLFGGK